MSLKRGTLLLTLLKKFEQGNEKNFLTLFSTQDQKILEKCLFPDVVSFDSIVSDEAFLKKIHPSWLDEPLEKKQSRFSTDYYFHLLREKTEKEEVLPVELLPPSPLNPLLDMSLERLFAIINLLGIYDLSFEMRRIIDKKIVSKIQQALSPSELNFLQIASKQPIKWIPEPLNLEKWDGDKKALHALLHKRGLFRLGKASFLEDSSFKWHLCHKIDKARGQFLMKMFAGKEDPAMITFFKGQVLHLIKRS